MTGATTRKGAARREEILAAALPLFLEGGVAGVTLDQIRDRSGASTGSIYHLFGGKHAIAAAVYVDSLTSYQRDFVDALWKDEGAEEGIRAVVRFHLDWCRANPDLARFLFTLREPEVVAAAQAQMEAENERFLSSVQSWWRLHAHHGALLRLTPEQSYAIWIGPAMELVRNWLIRGGRPPTKQDGEVLATAAWRAVGAAGSKPRRRASAKSTARRGGG
jgi:AcrR family transcriptional regulator